MIYIERRTDGRFWVLLPGEDPYPFLSLTNAYHFIDSLELGMPIVLEFIPEKKE